MQLDEALSRFDRGLFKAEKDFMHFAGLNLIDTDQGQAALRAIKEGNREAALDIFARNVVEDTMFAYRPEQAPTMFNGLLGKAFGQYGTYSTNFRENIWKGIKNGTAAQRIAFGARYVGNTLAIGSAVAALGINNKNFIPFLPMAFTGGPMFDLAINAIKATDPASFDGKQARAELDRLVPFVSPRSVVKGKPKLQLGSMTPFWYQAKAIQDFVSYSNQGKDYQAWLALTSTPIHPDFR